MSLESGTRLGTFEITGQIGAGGMGEVYRATDTQLGREVAIKTLPSSLANDQERLARFEREAKLLATLNHAHIAAVYSLDEYDGTRYLAMELVEGETLEQKLKGGALSVDVALHYALQIAEALEAAHEKGVVHRDLKPANVMVTRDGVVKVLDFGLAKAFAGDPDQVNPAHSPALSLAMTQAGLVLGTAGYMSPEQASGQATDQRADVWAFGVVLYEMLTGLPLFSGESVPHILAAVLQTEPDWARLPKHLHPRLKLLLERCLTKKPRNRLHAIADARIEIEGVQSNPQGGGSAAQPAQPIWRRMLPIATTVLVTAVLAGVAVWSLVPQAPMAPVRLTLLQAPNEAALITNGFDSPVAISPAGRHVAYASGSGELQVRSLDALAATSVAVRARSPFFSPDGRNV
jgi:serine/threonine protein kinase